MQTFERGVSEFVKDHRGVMDLHSVLRTLADKEVSDERKGSFFAVAQACGALAQAGPPVAPEAMKARFAACCFSNGADDLALVERSYRETFEQVLGKSKQLSFTGMEWVSTEAWAAFCLEVLPRCGALEWLRLNGNPNLAVDIVELVAKLPPTLKVLNLYDTGCFGEGTKAAWTCLPSLQMLHLDGVKVAGSKQELVSSGCRARSILVKIVH